MFWIIVVVGVVSIFLQDIFQHIPSTMNIIRILFYLNALVFTSEALALW